MLSNSSLAEVDAFLLTMMDEGIEREYNKLVEIGNGGLDKFYQTLQWTSIILTKSTVYDNPLWCRPVRGF